VFLLGAPLAWAVLLVFHPAPDPADVYGSLRGDATAMVVVHAGTLVFIGLMGGALFLLVRDLPGPAAAAGRLAVIPYVLFYGAAEAVLGVATGILVDHGDARAAQALWDDALTGDVLPALGAVAWLVGVLGAALAYRRAGAPLAVPVLLALSAIALLHAPPTGPFGLLCFAGAVAVLAQKRQRMRMSRLVAT
jgi:hypothetical protein